FFFLCSFHYLFVHSFPTRRSSDLFPHSALSQTSLLDACTDAEYYAKSDMCGYPNEARMENQQSPPDGPASSLYISPDPEYHLHRSEEHTSELQSRFDIVCRLLLEK